MASKGSNTPWTMYGPGTVRQAVAKSNVSFVIEGQSCWATTDPWQ